MSGSNIDKAIYAEDDEMIPKVFQAGVLIIFLLVCMISPTTSLPYSTLGENLLTKSPNFVLSIEKPINIASAAQGNSNPVNINVRVTQGVGIKFNRAEGICGLTKRNFNLKSLYENVTPIVIVGVNEIKNSADCRYIIQIIPGRNSAGEQTKWLNWIYPLQLDYLTNGRILTSAKFNLSI